VPSLRDRQPISTEKRLLRVVCPDASLLLTSPKGEEVIGKLEIAGGAFDLFTTKHE
jgi:hypothetical protein